MRQGNLVKSNQGQLQNDEEKLSMATDSPQGIKYRVCNTDRTMEKEMGAKRTHLASTRNLRKNECTK